MTDPDDMVLVRRGDLFHIDQMGPIDAVQRLVAARTGPAAGIRSCAESAGLERTVLDVYSTAECWDIFWDRYPRKAGKKAARKAWDKALKEGTPPMDIVNGAHEFGLHWADQPDHRRGFIPYPATWLNAGSWDDELVPHASEATRTDQTRENLTRAGRGAVAGERLSLAERMNLAQQRSIEGGS